MQKAHEQVFDLFPVQFVAAQHSAAQSRRTLVLTQRKEAQRDGEKKWERKSAGYQTPALQKKSKLQRDKEHHSVRPNFRDEKCKVFSLEGKSTQAWKKSNSCRSSSVLWDSNINWRFEEIHLRLHYSIRGNEWRRLRGQFNLCIRNSTHTLPRVGHAAEETVGRILDILYRYVQTTEFSLFRSLQWNLQRQQASNLVYWNKLQFAGLLLYNSGQKLLEERSQRSNRILV